MADIQTLGLVAQLAERRVRNAKAAGSTPAKSTEYMTGEVRGYGRLLLILTVMSALLRHRIGTWRSRQRARFGSARPSVRIRLFRRRQGVPLPAIAESASQTRLNGTRLRGNGEVYTVLRRKPENFGLWRSLAAHLTGGQGVAGSNPANPTGRMASNSIRCIVDTFRRRDGGTLPTKAGRRAWNPG